MKTMTNFTYPALSLFALACFAFSPQAQAVCQEGCDLPHFNTFLGADTITSNTTGTENTAIGSGALFSNTTGFANTANGAAALLVNTTGSNNTAVGDAALVNNTTGGANTAVGIEALRACSGNNNVALGFLAGQNLTGDNNIALGFLAGQNLLGDNNIDIGHEGGADDSGTIRMGTEGTHTATYIAGIKETPLARGTAVVIKANGRLGVRTSSARFKEAIKPMGKASEAIFSLQPVTFRYKKALDPEATPQFGLVAEEVAKAYPDLVARDEAGKPFTVRYDEVNAMLLNEFLKEHRKVEEQDATITQLKSAVAQQQSANSEQQKAIEALTATLKAQAAQIQKVSDRIGAEPPPRVVANN